MAWSEGRQHLALFYIHQMNQVNSRNDLGHDDLRLLKLSSSYVLHLM